ncbi:phytoene/squalene synthase family protein [Yoonia sp.]|uniref:phytoene/squalene synthase family protein n=1 Tax=Yoonia sp. TaxID=2212373 RepID=UPI003975AC05
MTPQEMLIHHARSFAPAARLLPRDDYDRIARLYALCRTVDDLADTEGGPIVQARLTAIAGALRAGPPEDAPDPLVTQARALFADHPAGLNAFADLVSTATSDTGTTCIADDAELDRYCMGVAGTVGIMVCALFDVPPQWHGPASDLGRAMQLTNICRDVIEDAQAGRRYLPYTLCPHTPADIATPSLEVRTNLRATIDELLARSDVLYANGRAGLPALPLRLRLAVGAAAAIYAGIGDELRARSCDPLAGRVFVPRWRKILLAAQGTRSQLFAHQDRYHVQH